MSLEHPFYAVCGVELPGADWVYVDERLEELRWTRPPGGDAEDVSWLAVASGCGPCRVVIGAAAVAIDRSSCAPVGGFTSSPEQGEVVRRAGAFVGHPEPVDPGWMLVRDLS